ncbi:MAG: UpxY family transcription antiterminator [Bacteroidales bacterium]|nr:UpxY family transcription antiterminator [Bacteroidales bacterium]
MNDLHWYIACTRSCQDRIVANALSARGLEVFVAVRREVRQWSDRKKVVDRLLIPRTVFVRCTELERRSALADIPYLTHFLPESPGSGKVATIPDKQMDDFIAMVDAANGEVTITGTTLRPGDMVRVTEGALEGRTVELVNLDGKDCIAVRLPLLGAACIQIDRKSVELLKK